MIKTKQTIVPKNAHQVIKLFLITHESDSNERQRSGCISGRRMEVRTGIQGSHKVLLLALGVRLTIPSKPFIGFVWCSVCVLFYLKHIFKFKNNWSI